MPDLRKHSNTSNIVRFKLTKSTDGTAFTGLTSSSSGLIISIISDVEATATAYTQAGSTIETITTLGTFATPTTNKCRFKEVDATNHPGLYEFQFADARFAVSSARRVVISVSGVTSLFSSDYEIELVQFDLFDAVRLGLTALPNATAGANGGLPLGDANGRVGLQAGTSAGQLDFTSGVVKANLAQILGTALTETAGQIAAAFKKFFDIASPTSTMNRITLVDTTTTNTDMRGTDNAATAAEMAKVPKSDSNVTWNATALASINAEADTALADYDAPTKAELDTAESNIRGADSDTLKTLSDQIDALLTTAMAEGYRATGATGSVRDLLYEILSHHINASNSGTTKTTKKLDKSTTAKTYTYDDASTPTAIEETT